MNNLDVTKAKYPTNYKNAVNALATCEKIDECKDWSDKALALASYAKQAEDKNLYEMATRIRARAIRRCGELLDKIKPAQGARTDLGRAPTRGKAARDAGLSEWQQKNAMKVAKIPKDEFDEQVESSPPPTIEELAGVKKKPSGFVQATGALGNIDRFARFCKENDAIVTANGVMPYEIEQAIRNVQIVTHWMTLFFEKLELRNE